MGEVTAPDLIDSTWEVLNGLDEDQRSLAFELLSVLVASIIDELGSIDAEGYRFAIARAADQAEKGFEDGIV